MAYANDISLIDAVRASAKSFKVASTWANGKSIKVADDFLFELYLLFRILSALGGHYDINYLPGVAPNVHAFPKKPANKAGRPRFTIRDKTSGHTIAQICAGTTAKDIHGHARGIDVSIQDPNASNDPVDADVLQIFDAKYRSDFTSQISHHEFSEFARWLELFRLRGSAVPPLVFGTLSDLQANCLVTNGARSTECDNECDRVGLVEIERFHPSIASFVRRP